MTNSDDVDDDDDDCRLLVTATVAGQWWSIVVVYSVTTTQLWCGVSACKDHHPARTGHGLVSDSPPASEQLIRVVEELQLAFVISRILSTKRTTIGVIVRVPDNPIELNWTSQELVCELRVHC